MSNQNCDYSTLCWCWYELLCVGLCSYLSNSNKENVYLMKTPGKDRSCWWKSEGREGINHLNIKHEINIAWQQHVVLYNSLYDAKCELRVWKQVFCATTESTSLSLLCFIWVLRKYQCWKSKDVRMYVNEWNREHMSVLLLQIVCVFALKYIPI